MGFSIYFESPNGDMQRGYFGYSVQRYRDEAFFDFKREVFRPLKDIPERAVYEWMRYIDGKLRASFDHKEDREAYVARVHDLNRLGEIVCEIPAVPDDYKELVQERAMEAKKLRSDDLPDDEKAVEVYKKLHALYDPDHDGPPIYY